jgi:hypothetical protein
MIDESDSYGMSKTFRPWDIEQRWLLPPSVHELIPAGHVAHFVRDTAREDLDLSAILSAQTRGHHSGLAHAVFEALSKSLGRAESFGSVDGVPPPENLPYGLDIWAPRKVLNIEWDAGNNVLLVSYKPGRWESELSVWLDAESLTPEA